MNTKPSLVIILIGAAVCLAPFVRAQDNPTNDPDVQKMLKEAQEIQKNNPPNPDMKKKMAEMEAQAKEEAAHQEQEEKLAKEKQQAALRKQLADPTPVKLPDWTPSTPQYTAKDALMKKIEEDEVRATMHGTSPMPPEEILAAWKAAITGKPLNQFTNNMRSNGSITTRIVISTRDEPRQEVELEASREAGEKITHVQISVSLAKPAETTE